MTDHDELREKVAVAIMQSGAGPTYGDTLRTMADAAIAVVLEKAAKVAEEKVAYSSGQEVMRDSIAAAIRNLIPKEKQDADKA
jgi:fructose 1,6-bisphosphatase